MQTWDNLYNTGYFVYGCNWVCVYVCGAIASMIMYFLIVGFETMAPKNKGNRVLGKRVRRG